MKTVRLHAPYDLRMLDEPTPAVGPGDVLIRIKSVGVCASDLHYYSEGRIGTAVVEAPIILGHEPSGVIEAVGSAVTNLKPGDRVAVEPTKPCRQCEFCRSGHTNVCPNVEFFGTPPIDGCFRELVAWPSPLAIPIPDNVSFDEAAMIEPLAVGVHAAKLAELKGGESVAVLGAGAIGLSALQAAKVRGASRVIVSEPIAERRQIALKLGADAVIDTSAGGVTEQAIAANNGNEPDVVFECAGMPDAFVQAVEIVRTLGTVVFVGIPTEDHYCLPASLARRKELTVKFDRRSCNEAEESIDLVSRGLVDVKSYVTHAFPLDRVREALELAIAKSDGVVRAVVHV